MKTTMSPGFIKTIAGDLLDSRPFDNCNPKTLTLLTALTSNTNFRLK
jgi:hypothetical protein